MPSLSLSFCHALIFKAMNHQPRFSASRTSSNTFLYFSHPLNLVARQWMLYFLWHLLSVKVFEEPHNSPAPQPKYIYYQNRFYLSPRSWEMAQKLRVSAALSEDLSSFPTMSGLTASGTPAPGHPSLWHWDFKHLHSDAHSHMSI